MKRVLKYVGEFKLRIVVVLIIKAIGTIMDLAIPYVLSYIIDDIIPQKDFKRVLLFGLLMLVFCAIGFYFNVIGNRMASYVSMNVTNELRHDLFEKIEDLSSKQIDDVTMPSLISRMTTDTYNVHQMVGLMQRLGVRAPILLIGGIIVTLTMDPVLTLILIAVLPIVTIISVAISKKSLPLFTKVQEALDNLVRIIRENITGIRVIKALSKADCEKERFNKVNKEVIDYELKSGFTMAKIKPIMNLLLNCGLVLVVVVGAIRVSNSTTTVGKIIAFTSYFTIILNAMLNVTRMFVIYSRSYASAIRIDYVLSLPVELAKDENEQDKSDYIVEFRNVNFYYNIPKDKEMDNIYNISNVSFCLKEGESIGIIGPTGSGKTTILNLLMRFYDPTSGQIFVSQKDVKSYDKRELRKIFGACLQNDTIFSDTVKNNIDFYRNISDEDILKASKCAQADEFVMNMPNKYEEFLSAKGTNISGGQKQRIFIARALANKPKILIFDDSSSALDYKTDSILRHSILKAYPSITSIIVSQRISSIINCTYIMMIDNGIVTGIGSHEKLLKTNTEYQEIYKAQMGEDKGGLYE